MLLTFAENRLTGEGRIKIATLRILHEEALKSFRQGSKAAADFLDAYSKRMG